MKPTIHKILTRIALDICGDKLNITDENKCEIILGTEDEDKNTLTERILNWHFFKSNQCMDDYTFKFFRTSSLCILNKRIIAMHTCPKNSKEYYNNLGRIIHHIQDMSTPSHVVPIFHALFIKDYFEEYMQCNINLSSLGEKVVLDNKTTTFKDLYITSAQNTLKYLKDTKFEAINSSENTKILPLSMFWQDYIIEENMILRGFGRYGKLHKFFKNNKVRDGYKRVDKELFKIHNDICNKAIQDTCDALLYSENIL